MGTGESLNQFSAHDDSENYVGGVIVLEHPFSRGTVHIRSTDPKDAPLIDPKYLSHPADLEIMSE